MSTSLAGPSRLPTISTEAEEIAAENGISSQSNDISAPSQSGGSAALTTSAPPETPIDPNALPETACETLYIQNLNEKVQVEGKWF